MWLVQNGPRCMAGKRLVCIYFSSKFLLLSLFLLFSILFLSCCFSFGLSLFLLFLCSSPHSAVAAKSTRSEFKRLPFFCCRWAVTAWTNQCTCICTCIYSISLQPFENPMCTPEGVVFDLMWVVLLSIFFSYLHQYTSIGASYRTWGSTAIIQWQEKYVYLQHCTSQPLNHGVIKPNSPWMPRHWSNWISTRIQTVPNCCNIRLANVTRICVLVCSGKYHCPVTFKVFNENSHIVAIRVTGNVYAYEVRCGETGQISWQLWELVCF